MIRFQSVYVHHKFFVVDKEELSIAGSFETDNAMRPRPFWGKLNILLQKIMFIQ